jgi:hypothetical protein
MLIQDTIEEFRNGANGHVLDLQNVARPYGFKLEDIKSPVQLWHGTEGKLSSTEVLLLEIIDIVLEIIINIVASLGYNVDSDLQYNINHLNLSNSISFDMYHADYFR